MPEHVHLPGSPDAGRQYSRLARPKAQENPKALAHGLSGTSPNNFRWVFTGGRVPAHSCKFMEKSWRQCRAVQAHQASQRKIKPLFPLIYWAAHSVCVIFCWRVICYFERSDFAYDSVRWVSQIAIQANATSQPTGAMQAGDVFSSSQPPLSAN